MAPLQMSSELAGGSQGAEAIGISPLSVCESLDVYEHTFNPDGPNKEDILEIIERMRGYEARSALRRILLDYPPIDMWKYVTFERFRR